MTILEYARCTPPASSTRTARPTSRFRPSSGRRRNRAAVRQAERLQLRAERGEAPRELRYVRAVQAVDAVRAKHAALRDDADVARRRQTISGRLRSEHPHRARRFAADRPPTDDRGSRDRRRRRRRSLGRVETRRFARARSLAAPSSARRCAMRAPPKSKATSQKSSA